MNRELTFALGSMMLAAVLLFGAAFNPDTVSGASGGGNVSIKVNVTNTPPVVIDVHIYDSIDPFTDESIDLTANTIKEVLCNATVSDLNGAGDIVNATARFYSNIASGFDSAADNNNHYRNTSCLETGGVTGAANNRSVVCRFRVQYYANNESWECNINVSDNGGSQLAESRYYFSANRSATTTMNELLAMTVPIQEIDFGNLSATETSGERVINVTNAGNAPTNFTIRAFGGNGTSLLTAETLFPNVSMMCETGNITVGDLRYSNTTGTQWANMINTTSYAAIFRNITLTQRTDDTGPQFGQDLNLTFWKIKIPTGVAGLCNGTIAFQATGDVWG